MSLNKLIRKSLVLVVALLALTGCKDKKSYADLLTDELHAVNYFLAKQQVINEIPENNQFIYGPDAPYYRIDPEGNLYMQVINPGTPDNKAEDNELIYFRYTRYNLLQFMNTGDWTGDGNSLNVGTGPTSFRFNNYTLSSTTTYGTGIQAPLNYLGVDCEVNLVIKSQYGMTEEIAAVTPFVYNLRYFRSPL